MKKSPRDGGSAPNQPILSLDPQVPALTPSNNAGWVTMGLS